MKVQAIRNNIARDLHDDIASTIGSINVYSEVAFDKIQKQQPVIAEEILQKIGSTSRIMIDRMSDIVWSINSTNDYLSNLVDRMKNFCSMTLSPRSIEFNFLVNERFSGIPLTMDKRKNIFLIFKECIHNILKYADCDQVDITITAQQNHIIMTIKDNGRGFNVKDYAPYNGNGLKNMKQRAESMRGEMHIFSAINQGTTISLKVRI